MSLSRSLTIAAGAGIAGLCLGLIVADRPAATGTQSQANVSVNPQASMVVFATTEHAAEMVDTLVAHFSAHGAMEVKLVDTRSPSRIVVNSVWASESAAQAAVDSPAFRALSGAGEAAQGSIQVAIIPIDPADRTR